MKVCPPAPLQWGASPGVCAARQAPRQDRPPSQTRPSPSQHQPLSRRPSPGPAVPPAQSAAAGFCRLWDCLRHRDRCPREPSPPPGPRVSVRVETLHVYMLELEAASDSSMHPAAAFALSGGTGCLQLRHSAVSSSDLLNHCILLLSCVLPCSVIKRFQQTTCMIPNSDNEQISPAAVHGKPAHGLGASSKVPCVRV